MLEYIKQNPERAVLIATTVLGIVAGILEKLGYTRSSKVIGFVATGDWGRVARIAK